MPWDKVQIKNVAVVVTGDFQKGRGSLLSAFLSKNRRILLVIYMIALFFCTRFLFLPVLVPVWIAMINYVLLLPSLGIALLLFRRKTVSFAVHSVFLYLLYYVDSALYSIRLTHLRYSDFFAIQDAVRVADRYMFPFSKENMTVLAAAVLFNFFLIIVSKRIDYNDSHVENVITGAVLLLSTGCFLLGGVYGQWIPDTTEYAQGVFDSNGTTEKDGMFYTLYNQFRNSRILEPEGYSPDNAAAILAQYREDDGANHDPVQIVVIMNESLSDYSLIGKTAFQFDPLPNIHNPENGYFVGKLAVSVYAGYTCNTEYEFLTGNSLHFFPPMYVPYSQLIVDDVMSIAWEARNNGLFAMAIHPYFSQEWNRRQVYPHLGFERFIAGENFSKGLIGGENIGNITDVHLNGLNFGDDLEYIRGFISDAECYQKIIESLNASTKESNFIFAVTVQNHGGFQYTGENFQNIDFIPGEDELNQYLTCSYLSDAAFHAFTQQLSERKERTLVLMFGDHQPGLDYSKYVDGYDEGQENLYYVPYILWSNFEIDSELPKTLSVNYLSALIKQCAGIPLTQWDQFRLDIMKYYPVMTANFVLNDKLEVIQDNLDSWLHKYSIVQYLHMTLEIGND